MSIVTLAPILYWIMFDMVEPIFDILIQFSPVFVVLYAVALVFKDAVRVISKHVESRLKKIQVYVRRKYRKIKQFIKA